MRILLRKLFFFVGLLIFTLSSWAQEPADTTQTEFEEAWYIHFKTGKSNLEEDYNDNAITLKYFTERIHKMQEQNKYSIAKIRITGYASPDGPIAFNNQLSKERAETLKDYILKHTNVSESMCELVAGGENWDELRMMIETSEMKHKDKVIDIINNTPEGSDPEIALRRLPDRTYSYMIKNFFPKLRSASSVQLLRKLEVKPTTVMIADREPVVKEKEEIKEDSIVVAGSCSCEPPLLGLRTNLAYWALLIPNIGIEAYIGNRYSLAVDGTYRWFNFKGNKHNYTVSTITGEFRYWLRDDQTFEGSYFGLYGRYGEYDIKLSGTGRLGYLGGGGLSYGYVYHFNKFRCLFFELGASVGYDKLNYAKYKWYDPCNAFVERKKCGRIGLTRINASLIWRF